MPTPLVMKYKNWEGKVAVRKVIPKRVYFGSTEWHPKKQWLMEAYDIEKEADRTFAMNDILEFNPKEQL